MPLYRTEPAVSACHRVLGETDDVACTRPIEFEALTENSFCVLSVKPIHCHLSATQQASGEGMAECDHLSRHCRLISSSVRPTQGAVLHITYVYVGWPCLQIEVQVVACISFSLPPLGLYEISSAPSSIVFGFCLCIAILRAPRPSFAQRRVVERGSRYVFALCFSLPRCSYIHLSFDVSLTAIHLKFVLDFA